jgi:hypothetical protein
MNVENFPLKLLLASLLTLISCSISACTTRPTSTAAPQITREKAIQLATGYCKIPHLVLLGEPENVRAKLLTLAEADQQTRTAGSITNYDIPLDTLVWLVQMDGQLQLVGGPPPVITPGSATPTPPQPFKGICSVILDANSGTLIVETGEPISPAGTEIR